jgi:ankyrin repeat protein
MAVRCHNVAIFHHSLDLTQLSDQALMTQGGELLYNMIASGFSGLVPIEALLSRGVMLDWPDYERRTALHLAAQAGLEAEVNALLANDAAILTDQNGNTPLHEAVKSGRLDIVRSILDHMQDDMENLLNHDHASALSQAVVQDDPEIFRFLLERGAKVNYADGIRSPLHWAAEMGRLPMFQALIQHGANVNSQDETNNIPLHRAFLGKQNAEVKLAELLVEADASLWPLNTDGKAAIHCALQSLKTGAFVSLLCVFGSMQDAIGVKDSNGQTVLH